MTDPADLAQKVLVAVAAFVRTLPADQLEDLANGAAKLELVPKGGRTARKTAAAAKPLPVPAGEVESMLRQIANRPAGEQYLADLKLGVQQLRDLAKALGVTVASKATKAQVITAIVEQVVGRRLDSDAITRMATR
ncbi:hypothetical protein GCM10010399_80300 [Dactylosporangium fulvum]|uniref:Rho termination factor N-terminal domain-containing protein n=1 Tax=Dactylosporangium fulvum TaxID=53359 RepID=A0ABY5VZS5_9ACTN|nr:Rho termination factor N-terminal domain-containing protein [Dactylosporangium fulvum]UWP81281.1 Rho termination factor N-terminal domain-containing protein [Dactylosporangium fulvum]